MTDLQATAEAYEDLGVKVLPDDVNILDLKRRLHESRIETGPILEELASREAVLKYEIARIEKEWRANNAELLQLAAEASLRLSSADTDLREALVERFRSTGEKAFDKQLSVRVSAKFEYSDSDAVQWAKTNAPILIVESVDRKAFESLPNVADLDFVSRTLKPSAVIASDLSK